MTTTETIKNRRSIRKFTDKNISENDLLSLKEAILRSPSSRGRNPWKFYFVQNGELLEKLSQCKESGAAFIADANLAVVVCGDENICDVWIEDCSIASIILQLTAHSIGLGTCWVQVRGRNYSNEISSEKFIQTSLNIEKNLRVLSMIAIGHPAETKTPHEYGELQFDKITDIK